MAPHTLDSVNRDVGYAALPIVKQIIVNKMILLTIIIFIYKT